MDCRIRGGEYVAYDRADYKTALKVWMPAAEGGDADAQNTVGEIFERGLGTEPNYVVAAHWFELAAKQGHKGAQFNLGTLYEAGNGVKQDKIEALNWYRRAWGLSDDSLQYRSDDERAMIAEAEKNIRKEQGNLKQQAEILRLREQSVSKREQDVVNVSARPAAVPAPAQQQQTAAVEPQETQTGTTDETSGRARDMTHSGRNFGYLSLIISRT